MTDLVDVKIRQWREATAGLVAPQGLVERIQRRLRPSQQACWYLGLELRQLGPLTAVQVEELWAAGELGVDTLCWRAGFDEWMPLSRVPELIALLTSRPPVVAPPKPNDQAAFRTASLLATLAQEDLAALSRPKAPKPAPPPEPVNEETWAAPAAPVTPLRVEMSWQQLPALVRVSMALGGVALLGLLVVVVLLLGRGTSAPSTAASAPLTADTRAPAASPVPPAPAVAAAESPVPPTPAIVDAAPREQKQGTQKVKQGPRAAVPRASAAPVAEPPVAIAMGKPTGDDFDREFGGGGSKIRKAGTGRAKEGSVYIPPAPGSGSALLPQTLGQADIIGVVLASKPALAACMEEQKKREPLVSGKVVMRWTILPSGKTTAVSCRTDEYKSSYMATCLGGLIKGWTFPPHKVQGAPVEFPFSF